ncbi:hypothetical protein D3C87_2127200 [compost metagenome]
MYIPAVVTHIQGRPRLAAECEFFVRNFQMKPAVFYIKFNDITIPHKCKVTTHGRLG